MKYIVILFFHLLSASGAFGQLTPAATPDCTVVSGVVVLRVQFLATGKVGEITVLKALPNGLTEQAIAAARKITFQPKIVDGVPQDTTRQIEYTFDLAYDEGSPDLRSPAEITKMPTPKFPHSTVGSGPVKTIELNLVLLPDGNVKVVESNGQFPEEIRSAASKAASMIKFKPAINKCGQPVSQTKVVRYEIK
jgi:TonB family protein